MAFAIVCDKEGDPTKPIGSPGAVLELKNVEVPEPGPGHIKVQISAASLNYADPLMIMGKYQVRMKTPFVPGCEASGTVLSVGPGVKRFKPGDKVVGFHTEGMFASQCVIPEFAAWPVPEGVDLEVAAAVPVTYGTADLALRHRSGVSAGQTVLVLGAGGGVGVAAVQIAKVQGARVIAVTQGAEKVAFLQLQGADAVIDLNDVTKEAPLHKLVKKHAPKGVNCVIDPVGGPHFPEALKTVAWGAHVVVIGFAAGGIPQIPANILLVKNTTVHGLYWGSYVQHKPKVLLESMNCIMGWLKTGQLKPHVSHRFPLDQLPEAFQTMLQRKMLGKIIVVPGTSSSKL